MRHPVQVTYRVVLHEGRMPSKLHAWADGLPLRAETVSTHLDADGNVWRLVLAHGDEATLDRIEGRIRGAGPADGLLEAHRIGRAPGRLWVWMRYAPEHDGRGPSLTAWTLRTLGPEARITDRTVDGALEVQVLGFAGPALRAFLERLPEVAARDHAFRLDYVGPPRVAADAPLLTATEAATLRAAQALGFFEVPRRSSIRAVAQAAGCSPSAASARLRRAHAKLAQAYGRD